MSVFIRLLLRYGAGFLVAKGLLTPGIGDELATDPDVINALEVGAGLVIGGAAEAWYYLARRFGWRR